MGDYNDGPDQVLQLYLIENMHTYMHIDNSTEW